MPPEAIDHALAAEDFARATALLEKYAWSLLNQGYVRRVESWMQSLPAEWRTQSPQTNLSFAWMYLLRGNSGRVIPHLQQIEQTLRNAPEQTDLRAEYLALKANLLQSQGEFPEAIKNAKEALEITSPGNARILGLANLGLGAGYRQAVQFNPAVDALQQAIHLSRDSGDSVTGVLAATHLILMSLQHGRLNLAEEVSLQTIDQMERTKEAIPPIIGAVYGALGLVYYERNQIEQARDHYLRGIQLGTFLGHHASLVYTKLNLSRLLLAEGNLIDANKNLEDAQKLVQAGAPDWLRPSLIAHQVQYFLVTGNLPKAEAILHHSGILPGEQISHTTDEIQLAYLRVMQKRASQADLQKGITLAEKILTLAENGQRNKTAMLALILGALLHEQSGEMKLASMWLERALALAEPEGYIRPFLDEGPKIAVLLKRLTQTDYVRTLLAAFPTVAAPTNRSQPIEGIIEPLSERELEVLRLLAQGLKYAEIAARLIVSMNTVRFHVKSIYGKLNVDKQVKAIERARELRLIE
jgi:LuxR family maltose regulon positive regulatory protein